MHGEVNVLLPMEIRIKGDTICFIQNRIDR